jgi:cysteine-rich repeat protein
VLAGGTTADGFGVLKLAGATGDERWRGGAGITATGLALDAAGDVLVAGGAVVKLDGATGAERWRTSFGDGGVAAVAVDPGGNVFGAGRLQNGPTLDGLLVKLDGGTGAELWRVTLGGPVVAPCDLGDCGADDELTAIALDRAGNPVAGGVTDLFRAEHRTYTATFTVLKVDAASGAQLWRFAGAPGGQETARAVAIDRAGDVLAGGTTGAGGDGCVFSSSPYIVTRCAFTVVKLSGTTGTELWRRTLPGARFDGAQAVAADAANDALAAGTSGAGFASTGSFTVVKLAGASGGGPDCGNGIVEPGEDCDTARASGDCCSSTCRLEASGTLCRPATDFCDAPDVCSGTSGECPFTSVPDTDGDLLCDAIDPCTGDRAIGRAKLVVTNLLRPGANRILFRGDLPLPSPAGRALDPASSGLRVVQEREDGVPALDVTIPGGPGWRRVGGRRRWRWASRPGVQGITRVRLRTTPAGAVRFRIEGDKGTFMADGSPALTMMVIFDPMGRCGAARFGCVSRVARGGTISCD